jgi:hypothetical protein
MNASGSVRQGIHSTPEHIPKQEEDPAPHQGSRLSRRQGAHGRRGQQHGHARTRWKKDLSVSFRASSVSSVSCSGRPDLPAGRWREAAHEKPSITSCSPTAPNGADVSSSGES